MRRLRISFSRRKRPNIVPRSCAKAGKETDTPQKIGAKASAPRPAFAPKLWIEKFGRLVKPTKDEDIRGDARGQSLAGKPRTSKSKRPPDYVERAPWRYRLNELGDRAFHSALATAVRRTRLDG